MVQNDLGELLRQERDLVGKLAEVRSSIAAAQGDEPVAGGTTSASGALLYTAVEKARMAMILTDPSLPDNPIVFANRAF